MNVKKTKKFKENCPENVHVLTVYLQCPGSGNWYLSPVSVVVPDLAPVAEDAMEEELDSLVEIP